MHQTNIHMYGTDGSLTQYGITDKADPTISARAHNDFMVLTINHEGIELNIFDSTNGKFMLKIADALMTIIQEQALAEDRANQEREHFNTICGDCLLPLTTCGHAEVNA